MINECGAVSGIRIDKGIASTMRKTALLPLFFFFKSTAPIWALAFLHETLHLTSVF
jgi:hypothetical protein